MDFLTQMFVLVGAIIAVVAGTPPAWKRLHGPFNYIRNYALRDILLRLKRVEEKVLPPEEEANP